MKNSICHKYQKMTLAKLSKKMEVIRGIYVVSSCSLSTRQLLGLTWSPGGSGAPGNFLLLSAYLSAVQNRAFILEFIGPQFQKEDSPALWLIQFLNFWG